MRSSPIRAIFLCALAVFATVYAGAQTPAPNTVRKQYLEKLRQNAEALKNRPITLSDGSAFVHTLRNGARLLANGKILDANEGSLVGANGLEIECPKGAFACIVLSNRTAIVVLENSKLRVDKFAQDMLFKSDITSDLEPSVSATRITLLHGKTQICQPALRAQSTFEIASQFAAISSRIRRATMEAAPNKLAISLLEGNAALDAGKSKMDIFGRQKALVEKRADGLVLAPEYIPMRATEETKLNTEFTPCKVAASGVDFRADGKKLTAAFRIAPQETFIGIPKYRYK